MYKNKKEVDAHVRIALSKLKDEKERNARGLTIAKLYFRINEFSCAEQYLLSFLNVKEENHIARKMLGQCYQKLGQAEKALKEFQRSLQLNPKQPDLISEVCLLLLEDKNLNNNVAKYWCDLAESENIQNESVFSLRLKLLNKDNNGGGQVEEMVQKEIAARPDDVQLRVRLLRHYIDQKRINDAYQYIYDVEMSFNDVFSSSGDWYNIVWLVLSKYEQLPSFKKDWQFFLMVIICLERQVGISFLGSAGTTETANLLFNLDQYLFKVSQLSEKFTAQSELVELFLDHYTGQLLIHIIAFIFKKEINQNKNRWTEAVTTVLPLLLLAFQLKVADSKEQWTKHCNEHDRKLIQLWNREGAFRCVQAGHTLLSCIREENSDKSNITIASFNGLDSQSNVWNSYDELLSQIRISCTDKTWRHNIFRAIFCNSDQKVKENSSMLIRSPKLVEPIFELPAYANVEKYEETAQYLKPQSLQHMVYICLGNENLAYVHAKYFNSLNFSTQNLAFCAAESLNQLDIDSFLYACVIQAKRMLEVDRNSFDNYNLGIRNAAGKPIILPFVNMQQFLGTEEQANWWTAAYQVYKSLTGDNLAETRSCLQYGIEAVRGVNGPKMDIVITFKLGKIFVVRAQDIMKPVEKAHLEARAENIYKYGLNMMKMNSKNLLEPYRKYFKYANANSSTVDDEISISAEDALSYLAPRYFKKGEFEEFIDELNGVELPFATYLQSEAYCKLDEANKTPKKVKRTYLDRATECLQRTVTLLKSTRTDPNHPLNSIIHAQLKRVQQMSSRLLNENIPFNSTYGNNSSTYEDAEADLYAESPVSTMNRSRRDATSGAVQPLQLASLITVKDEIIEALKPELISLRKDVCFLKEKVNSLEEAMKKIRISSNPPSRDEGAHHVLDDLYMIDDALQNQLYQAGPQSVIPGNNNLFPNANSGHPGPINIPFAQQQQRIHTPNASQNVQNAAVALNAVAFNSPIFNPNYPLNYYPTPYMMAPQCVPNTGNLLGQRNQLPLPFMDPGAMSFNLPQTPSILPPSNQDGRSNNLYGLLNQAQPVVSTTPLPLLSAPMPLPSLASTPSTTFATGTATVVTSSSAIQFNKTLNNQPVEKGPPANVVITSSDPLPNPSNTSFQTHQPTLSVTIPSHHIKPSLIQTSDSTVLTSGPQTNINTTFNGFGLNATSAASTAANFWNSTSSTSILGAKPPCGGVTKTSSSNSIFSFSLPATTSSTFFKPPVVEEKESALIDEINKTTENVSSTEPEVEYDPCPDFKPIIPLPAEIEVKTGEEDEEVMFCGCAKLYRHVDKEWKERGSGDIKILKAKDGSFRVLMRRFQTHKICVNHKITKDIVITTPKNESKGLIWAAMDFTDEELKLEKFFARFKQPENEKEFLNVFKKAQTEIGELATLGTAKNTTSVKDNNSKQALSRSSVVNFTTSTPSGKETGTGLLSKPSDLLQSSSTSTLPSVASALSATTSSKSLFGSSLLPPTDAVKKPEADPSAANPSPFANFTFDKNNTASSVSSSFANIFSNLGKLAQPSSQLSFNKPSLLDTTSGGSIAAETSSISSSVLDGEDDYVPTAVFEPLIPLPELVDVSTGEENELILFEHRAKLLRFDKNIGEWKERGLGNIKLLQDKDDVNMVRLVMRRDKVHKLCCNQRLYKDTQFVYTKNSKVALTWVGQDYSENELVKETFSLRFKTPEICASFKEAITAAQTAMSNEGGEKKALEERQSNDKKEQLVAAIEEKSKEGFGDAFKPKPGAWSCQGCYVSNAADSLYCVACDAPKDETVPKKVQSAVLTTTSKPSFNFGFSPSTTTTLPAVTPTSKTASNSTFSFGFGTPNSSTSSHNLSSTTPNTTGNTSADITPNTTSTGSSFGDRFKPKPGSWSCGDCYLSNSPDVNYCKACNAPKDSTVPKKDTNILALTNPALKFSFGFADTTSTSEKTDNNSCLSSNVQAEPNIPSFKPPINVNSEESTESFTFMPPVSSTVSFTSSLSKSTFSFTMQSNTATMPTFSSLNTLPKFSLDKKEFSFTMKPKSPGKGSKSPSKHGDGDVAGDEEDDAEYHEEEENTYHFTPVIPLPDMIDVKTGEEDEDVLYVHRAKLYRFIDGEWKERGLGDLKILRHKETNKLRVVMRRKQVHKICLNHILNEDVEYKYKDEKSWLFCVNDFSEGTTTLEKFSLRFKNKDIAQKFMEAVRSSLAGTAEPIVETGDDASLSEISSLPESARSTLSTKISAADKELADKLSLPHEFYTEKPNCKGCRGCNSDEFVFTEMKSENFVHNDDKLVQLPYEYPLLAFAKKTPNTSIIKQSSFNTSNTTPQPAASMVTKKDDTLCSGVLFAAPLPENATEKSSNSFTDTLNNTKPKSNESAPASRGFLFGSGSNTGFGGDKKYVFGQASPIFGQGNANGPGQTPSIFGGNFSKNFAENTPCTIFGSKPLFGAPPDGSKTDTTNQTTDMKTMFGNPAQLSDIGSGGSKLGSTATISKSNPLLDNAKLPNSKSATPFSTIGENKSSNMSTFADLSKKGNMIDFASLAAKTSETSLPKPFDKVAKPGTFIGLTNQDAFSSFLKSPNNGQTGNTSNKIKDASEKVASDNRDNEQDENYDPHYDPIIELPHEIVVSTGEEEETKLFGERATLYRYDTTTKEWKERGVGELKILFHPGHQTYRLLLRREQIHKLVLNHSIAADLNINNMNSNPKSFVWACYNYAESNEGVVEKLAVRFKKVEIAEQFNNKVKECIEVAKKRMKQTTD